MPSAFLRLAQSCVITDTLCTTAWLQLTFSLHELSFIWQNNSFPKQSLPLWGPSYTLLIRWSLLVSPRGEDVVVFSETAAPFSFSIRHFSESCCGCSETHNYVLHHPCSDPWVVHFCHMSLLIFTFSNCVISLRPLWSSTSFKNGRFYKHSWSSPFLSWSINIDFS